jgi:predicted transcriptional regulator
LGQGREVAEREELLRLAAGIVSAHASNNALPADQLPALIQQVFSALATAQQSAATPPTPEPAVSVRASVHQDHLVCLDCGKHFSMLKRHLMNDHQLTPTYTVSAGSCRRLSLADFLNYHLAGR